MKQKKYPDLYPITLRVKSVPTLPAPTTNLCDHGVDRELRYYDYIVELITTSSLTADLKCLLDVMLSSGCRVSEAISKRGIEVRLDGSIVIYQSKTKKYLVTRTQYHSDYLKKWRGRKYMSLSEYSRFQVYRIFKKYGLEAQFEGSTYSSVTHLARKINGALIYANTGNLDDVAKSLNHSNKKNSEYYVKKIKK
jgi:integrase